MGNIDDARSQRLRLLTGCGWVATTVSAEPLKAIIPRATNFTNLMLVILAEGRTLPEG